MIRLPQGSRRKHTLLPYAKRYGAVQGVWGSTRSLWAAKSVAAVQESSHNARSLRAAQGVWQYARFLEEGQEVRAHASSRVQDKEPVCSNELDSNSGVS